MGNSKHDKEFYKKRHTIKIYKSQLRTLLSKHATHKNWLVVKYTMADLGSTHQGRRSNGQDDECEDGMFRRLSGNTGEQGEDNNKNDAYSSDDESITTRENENNTSNIPPNSGNHDNRNRRTTSGGRNSRELDSSFGNRRVTGGELQQQHAYMMSMASVLHPERRYWQHGSWCSSSVKLLIKKGFNMVRQFEMTGTTVTTEHSARQEGEHCPTE